MSESAPEVATIPCEIASGMLELSRILIEFTGVFRRHVANTSIFNDHEVTARNLDRLDELEARLRAALKALELPQ